jgi:hypothetical protein
LCGTVSAKVWGGKEEKRERGEVIEKQVKRGREGKNKSGG